MAIKSKEILSKLIQILLIVALPLGEIARITFNEIAFTFLDISVFVLVVFWLISKKEISKPNLLKPILIFVVVLLASLVFNFSRLTLSELITSSLYLFRWVFYSLIYFVVLDLSLFKTKIEKAITLGGTVIVTTGFIQYFLYPDLRNLYYAGWDEHLFRMFTWTFFDPNFAGIFFVLFFLFQLGTLKVNDKKTLILPTLILISILLTFSRSAYIALFAGVFAYSFFLKNKKNYIFLLGLVLVAILGLAAISSKSEGTNLLRTASGEARLDSMRKSITVFKDHPVFGIGFNSYRYTQKDYGFLDESKMIVHSGAGTDNSFLFVLATSGIVGFSALIYLLFRMFKINDVLIKSSLIALVVNSFFINSFFYPPIMLWMWLVLALRKRNV